MKKPIYKDIKKIKLKKMVCTMLWQLIRKFKGKGFSSKIQILKIDSGSRKTHISSNHQSLKNCQRSALEG